jgi:DNA polymerase (family 10)
LLCINTDAHRQEMFDHMVFGVAMARRAWCEAGDILNTRSLDGLLAWLAKRGNHGDHTA